MADSCKKMEIFLGDYIVKWEIEPPRKIGTKKRRDVEEKWRRGGGVGEFEFGKLLTFETGLVIVMVNSNK